MRVARFLLVSAALVVALAACRSTSTPPGPGLSAIDRSQWRAGKSVYQATHGQRSLGRLEVELSYETGTLVVRTDAAVPAEDYEDRAEVRLEARTGAPRSVRATGRRAAGALDVDLRFEQTEALGHTVTGTVLLPELGTPRRVEVSIPRRAVERRGLPYLVPGLKLDKESSHALYVFQERERRAPGVIVQVTGLERVEVPAGSFECWRVELRGDRPSRVLWITTGGTKRIVKMAEVGQPWTWELLAPERAR